MANAKHTAELMNANREYSIARAKWAIRPDGKERREWAEKMEFWGNKAAFLNAITKAGTA